MPDRVEPLVVGGRFANPIFDGASAPPATTFADFRRWRRERRGRLAPDEPSRVPRARPDVPREAPRAGIAATWVGHSSVILQIDGATFLCDPVWSARIGFGTVKRLTEPGVRWEDVPRVDGLLVSHNHYDHLDAATVKRLPRATPVVCPLGVAAWFRRLGFSRVTELSWWRSVAVGEHKVTLVPAQHFSGRGAFDRNKTLWAGIVVEGASSSAYFAGDSGYFPAFRQVGEAFPDLDLVMMPIGAYEPRWFMGPVHVDPAEGAQAFLDTGGRAMLPIHWGAFRLADETIDAPAAALRAWWDDRKLDAGRLRVAALGETVRL